MYYIPAIFVGMFLLLLITRPFTVLFHELGHAIPLMLMTKKGAIVYVGSYGNQKHSFRISLGNLDVWIRYNPLKWQGGLCVPKATDISIKKQIVFILCGSIFSLLICIILFLFTFTYEFHGSIKLICTFALGSTIIDLFANLIPRKIKLADESILYSDGYHLLKLQELNMFTREYEVAIEIYLNKQYDKAGKVFEDFMCRGLTNEDI